LTIENADEYRALIAKSLHNWDAERVAYMDHIILLVAISEIVNFNNIALEVSMNEYIELAKEYSSDKSYQFINGVLNNVVKELQKNNILFKVIKK
jgi:N utilization substance protein B